MVQLTAAETGAAGEQLVALEFIKRGAEVYFPAGIYGADMVVCVGCRLYRVQVKTTAAGAKTKFRFRDTMGRVYASGAVDVFAAASLELGQVALLPGPQPSSRTVDFDNLRPEWAFDYVYEWMREGGIAQCTQSCV